MLCIKKNENQIYDAIFFVSYSIWMTAGVLNLTMFRYMEIMNSTVRSYMQNIAYLLLVLLFFMKKRDKVKDALGIGIILTCCVLARHASYNLQIIPVSIYLYFSIDIEFKKVLKCTLIIQAVIMIISILASQTGLIEDVIWVSSSGMRQRHSLGYDYCAYPAHLLLFMTMIWFCLCKKIRLVDIAIALALNYLLYVLTDSRADFVLAIVGSIGFLLWNREYSLKCVNRIRNFLVEFGFWFAAVVSILVQFFYNAENGFMARLNSVLSGRLRLGHNAICEYGFSLFGKKVHWYGQGHLREDPTLTYNYVDNAFLKEGITYGLVFLTLLGIGFTLTGKVLIMYKEYKLSWAMMISLGYSVINAHLCMLTFNVFILLLGYGIQGLKASNLTVKEWTASHINVYWKSALRIGLFLIMLFSLAFVETQGIDYMVDNARLLTWIFCGFFFLISILCLESDPYNIKNSSLPFVKFLLAFLILLCISDFFVDKKFRFAAFGILAFGGIFCKCWGTMEKPEQLIREFKYSYKIWFITSVVFCILFCPFVNNICYSGIFPEAETFALWMMISLIVFLSDSSKTGKCMILNGIGVIISLYFIWASKQTAVVLASCLILIVFIIYWLHQWIKTIGEEKKKMLTQSLTSIALGCAVAYVIRGLLRILPYTTGAYVFVENENQETVGITFTQLFTGSAVEFFSPIINCFREYFANLNWLGHNFLLTIDEVQQWCPNSALMIAFRYGVLAGIAFIIVMLMILYLALKDSFNHSDFFATGILIGCFAAGMLLPIEKPFVSMPWIIMWLGIGWLIVKRQPCSRSHGNNKFIFESNSNFELGGY